MYIYSTILILLLVTILAQGITSSSFQCRLVTGFVIEVLDIVQSGSDRQKNTLWHRVVHLHSFTDTAQLRAAQLTLVRICVVARSEPLKQGPSR